MVPRVIITSGGVTLPVLTTADAGWTVQTPCGRTATVPRTDSVVLMGRADIVLDAGHGGPTESGAVGANGVQEAEVNLAVARLAAAKLEGLGFLVVLTRGGDYRLPIASRADIADALAAPLVSIQHNGGAASASTTPGTELVYRWKDANSRRLAGLIWEETTARLAAFGTEWVAGGDAGVTYRLGRTDEDYYGIVRLPASTSVLAEMSYIGHATEAQLLTRADFLAAEAEAIVVGVRRWLESNDPGSGFIEPSYRLTDPGVGGGSIGCQDPSLT